MEIHEGVENPYDEPFLWRVELYLVSKYQPEFYEQTIFKLRSAAIDRGKIVKERDVVHQSLQSLENAIISDLNTIPLTQQKTSHHASKNRETRPGIREQFQKELYNL